MASKDWFLLVDLREDEILFWLLIALVLLFASGFEGRYGPCFDYIVALLYCFPPAEYLVHTPRLFESNSFFSPAIPLFSYYTIANTKMQLIKTPTKKNDIAILILKTTTFLLSNITFIWIF